MVANKHIPVLVATRQSQPRQSPGKTWSGGRYDWMREVLATEHGRQSYRKRKQTIEPIFGHTKHNSGVTRFLRRGRAKVRTEWRLLMMTHNLTKPYSHQIAATGPETRPHAITPPFQAHTATPTHPPASDTRRVATFERQPRSAAKRRLRSIAPGLLDSMCDTRSHAVSELRDWRINPM